MKNKISNKNNSKERKREGTEKYNYDAYYDMMIK